MKNFDDLLDEQMEDPEFRKEYVRLLDEARSRAKARADIAEARLAAVEREPVMSAPDPVQAVTEALAGWPIGYSRYPVQVGVGAARDMAAAAVNAARPAIEREAKAEAWDEGFADGQRQDGEGADGPRYVNPYRAT